MPLPTEGARTSNPGVAGSTPARGAKFEERNMNNDPNQIALKIAYAQNQLGPDWCTKEEAISSARDMVDSYFELDSGMLEGLQKGLENDEFTIDDMIDEFRAILVIYLRNEEV